MSLMTPARRAMAMLVDPSAEWARIERESGDLAYLLSRYVAVLALVPAVSSLIGASIVGAVVPDVGLVRATPFDGLLGAIFAYAESLAIVVILGFIINVMAPSFDARKDFDNALKLAVYSFTPVWLAGIVLVLPGLRFLALTGLYATYPLATGLPRLMKTPAPSPTYVAVIVVCALLLTVGAITLQRAIFGTPGI
jgi:hypothetical protein